MMTEEKRQALIIEAKEQIRVLIEQKNTWGEVWIPFLDHRIELMEIALASLEAPILGYIHKSPWAQWKQATCTGDEFGLEAYKGAENHFAVYRAPPVPVLKLPEQIHIREPGFIGWVYDAQEIEAALLAARYEVKE